MRLGSICVEGDSTVETVCRSTPPISQEAPTMRGLPKASLAEASPQSIPASMRGELGAGLTHQMSPQTWSRHAGSTANFIW